MHITGDFDVHPGLGTTAQYDISVAGRFLRGLMALYSDLSVHPFGQWRKYFQFQTGTNSFHQMGREKRKETASGRDCK